MKLNVYDETISALKKGSLVFLVEMSNDITRINEFSLGNIDCTQAGFFSGGYGIFVDFLQRGKLDEKLKEAGNNGSLKCIINASNCVGWCYLDEFIIIDVEDDNASIS